MTHIGLCWLFSQKTRKFSMLILGLTGGIATGKSTVSKILSQAPYYIPIIDADIIARRVVEPGTRGYKQIIAHFSSLTPDLLMSSSENLNYDISKGAPLNRAALGQCVFGEAEQCRKNRSMLNSIVHPAVRREIIKEVLKAYICGHWIVVLDVPLLFEGGLDILCAAVMVVAVRDPQVQMKRLLHRDPHLSHIDAENRVLSQENLQEKVKRCVSRGKGKGVVIYNDDQIEELNQEVQRAISILRGTSPRWWTFLLFCCPLFAGLVAFWHYARNLLLNRRWEKQQSRARTEL